jgi:hypothetical protein
MRVTAQRRRVNPRPRPDVCPHSLALDMFDARFGLRLRRLSCLLCGHGWWESGGTVIGSTEALRLVAVLSDEPRPVGWAAAEKEWRKLTEESLAPLQ